MSTKMNEEDWSHTLAVFRACLPRRGRKADDDRRFLEAIHFFTVENVRWRALPERFRVTVQLIDGETETHLWAERYDRKLEDIFHPGRDHRVYRFDPIGSGRGRTARSRQEKDDGEYGGLRISLGRQDPPPQVEPRGQRRGSSCARSRHRARSKLRPCSRLDGVRERSSLVERLV